MSQGWLCGTLPSARAGMAVTMRHGDIEAIVYGGAQYVANRWYRDVFELQFATRVPLDPDYNDDDFLSTDGDFVSCSDDELLEAFDSDDEGGF